MEIFKKALIKNKLRKEKERLALLERLNSLLNKLSTEYNLKEIYFFGSITKPYRFDKNSDIDIGIIGLRDEYFFKLMSILSRELNREVNLIQLEKHRLKEKILREGIRWKRKNLPY